MTLVQDKKYLGCLTLCVLSLVLLVTEMMTPGIILPRNKGSLREPCHVAANTTTQRLACPTCSTKPNPQACPTCPKDPKPQVCPTCPKDPKPQVCPTCPKELKSEVCPTCPKAPNPRAFSEDKKDIAQKLSEIQLALRTSLAHKSVPKADLVLKLEGIIEQLDPAYKLSNAMESAKEVVNTSVVLDVCPEEYLGEKYGYPFFHTGWVVTNCSNAKSLPQVLSILLNTLHYPDKDELHVGVVLKGINTVYPGVRVYMAPKNDNIKKLASHYKNVTIVNATKASTLGSVWNQLVSLVTTPYALIARDVVHFDFSARLERQIRMISDTDYVGVVGGAFRNLSGHWRIGCRQTRMMNYVLKFQEGYHYSRKSCMFCDDLEGPFVARTDILKSIKFKEKLPKEVIFEDFFIRVVRSGSLVMNCPDVMYYTTDYSSELKRNNKQTWLDFAKDWTLVRVFLPRSVRHAFSCNDISYKCSVGVTKSSPLPQCCLEQFGSAMQFLQEFCVKNYIPFELDAGSVLAAVKFSNYNPFDLDGDLSMLSWNYSFIQQNMPYFKKNGYPITSFQKATVDSKGKLDKKGYFYYNSPEIYSEAYGFDKMSADLYLPPELRRVKYYTKVRVDGHWINSMFNPGLFARNRYGLDVLKHSQSWLHVGGMGSSWGRYKPGKFLKCADPNFHSCLDKFPADGNIAFMVDD